MKQDQENSQNKDDSILTMWEGQMGFGIKIPNEQYVLFKNRIKIQKGFLTRETLEIRLNKIEHVVLKESLLDRLLGVGSVQLKTRTAPIEKTTLRVKNPDEVLAIINQACYDEAQAYLWSKGKAKNKYKHDKSEFRVNKKEY